MAKVEQLRPADIPATEASASAQVLRGQQLTKI